MYIYCLLFYFVLCSVMFVQYLSYSLLIDCRTFDSALDFSEIAILLSRPRSRLVSRFELAPISPKRCVSLLAWHLVHANLMRLCFIFICSFVCRFPTVVMRFVSIHWYFSCRVFSGKFVVSAISFFFLCRFALHSYIVVPFVFATGIKCIRSMLDLHGTTDSNRVN